MAPPDARRARELFLAARELPEEERRLFLEESCGGDAALRDEVASLLDHDSTARTALDSPAVGGLRLLEIGGAPSAAPPASIGPYRVERMLGRGGSGIVYLVRGPDGAELALKLLRPELAGPRALGRLEREARILARLDHPGIARVVDSGREDLGAGPQPWFAMERVEGEPITDFAEARSLDLRARLALLARVADAVQHAHHHGVVHRDLKPANVMVRADGAPVVLDFGTARVADVELRATVLETRDGELAGTLPYMSPEQVAGDPDGVDTRSDVYSLGVLGYELCTGALPHDLEGLSLLGAAEKLREDDPVPARARVPRLVRDVDTILGRALEPRADRRYATAAELAADLRRFLRDEPIAARPPGTPYLLLKLARRHRVAAAVLAALPLALAIALLLAWRHTLRVEEEAAKLRAVLTLQARMFRAPSAQRHGPNARVADFLADAVAELDHADHDPEIEALLRQSLGTSYSGLGMSSVAVRQFRRSLELGTGEKGADHVWTLGCQADLATALVGNSELDEAAALVDDGLERATDALGPMHPARARFLHIRSEIEQLEGRVVDAEASEREAVEIAEAVLEIDHPVRSAIETHHVELIAAAGRLEEALALADERHRRICAAAGPGHPTAAKAGWTLGNVQLRAGRFAESAATFRELLVHTRERFGPDNPTTRVEEGWLARALLELGELEEARELLEGVVAQLSGEQGALRGLTLEPLGWLARIDREEGDEDSAIERELEAFRVASELYGLDDVRSISILVMACHSLRARHRFAEAEQLFRDALEPARREDGGAGRASEAIRRGLAGLAAERGDLAGAAAMLDALRVEMTEALGADHERVRSLRRKIEELDLGPEQATGD